MEKVLIFGATGAMGSYLTEKMAAAGYQVDAVSKDQVESDLPNLRYIQTANAKDPAFIEEIMQNHYDAMVDFMSYKTVSFRTTFPKYLENVGRYVYLSSCRVFANEETPITERSPRLLDVSTDPQLLFSDDYCLHKARGENALRASKYRNWIIVRPSTTYSRRRCQLLTLEREHLLPFIRSGKPVPLAETARNIPASLSWGGDVAEMIFRLLFNDKALCDDFNVTSSKYHTWEEIAEIYHDVFGLNYEWVDELSYQRFRKPDFDPEKDLAQLWQLKYARLFDRIYDNRKVLEITGLKEEELLSLRQGLTREKQTILEP